MIGMNIIPFLVSASQMWELVNVFAYIIEPVLPPDDTHYLCFMILNDIGSMLLSSVIALDQVPYLRILIKEYLENFKTLYPSRSLTPKFHYLVHTPSFILR